MSSPFLAQIVMFGGTFAPRSWADCSGQILPISQNTALFSLLGTTYGGDGRVTFALPDLRGRFAMHTGTGPGPSPRQLGARGGTQTKTLIANNLPPHSHSYAPGCNSGAANSDTPVANYPAVDEGATESYHTGSNASMGVSTTNNTGNGQAFDIMNPFLVVRFIIATQGIFPSRN